jgi:hypothetical protein
MRKQTGLTRIDAMVALACVALVLAQAAVLNAGGRQRSKREVCLANLRMLTAAWQMYADDNAGNLVNGAPQGGTQCPDCPPGNNYKAVAPTSITDEHYKELPWIGNAYGTTNECCQKCAINTGALWKYVQDYNIYRCPVGKKGEMITYAIVDGANGLPRTGTEAAGVWMKNRSQIIKPASRFVFIDEGKVSPDSYAVYYNESSTAASEKWFDPPPVRHEGGMCVSFADGHSAHHKWKSKETITIGSGGSYSVPPTSCAGRNDLYWMQIGCWGKLGYTPSCPVNLE